MSAQAVRAELDAVCALRRMQQQQLLKDQDRETRIHQVLMFFKPTFPSCHMLPHFATNPFESHFLEMWMQEIGGLFTNQMRMQSLAAISAMFPQKVQ